MPKITENNHTAIRRNFLQTAAIIHGLGFRVFIYDDPETTFGYYSDGLNIAYFQECENQPGVNTAIVRKTPGSNGRHLVVERHSVPVPDAGITKDYLEKAFRAFPEYFSPEEKEMMYGYRYHDLNDFLRSKETEGLKELK